MRRGRIAAVLGLRALLSSATGYACERRADLSATRRYSLAQRAAVIAISCLRLQAHLLARAAAGQTPRVRGVVRSKMVMRAELGAGDPEELALALPACAAPRRGRRATSTTRRHSVRGRGVRTCARRAGSGRVRAPTERRTRTPPTAHDGQGTSTLLQQRPSNRLLDDVQMPHEDASVAESIRQHEHLAQHPVLPNNGCGERDRSLAGGCLRERARI
jgi:hypothetical protein